MRITGYTKKFGDLAVFEDFSVEFYDRKINCIMGPSGCGKTTLLNMIAGLDGNKSNTNTSLWDKSGLATSSCPLRFCRLVSTDSRSTGSKAHAGDYPSGTRE